MIAPVHVMLSPIKLAITKHVNCPLPGAQFAPYSNHTKKRPAQLFFRFIEVSCYDCLQFFRELIFRPLIPDN